MPSQAANLSATASAPDRRRAAFVTGASGFCGRHLVRHLNDSGYEVVGYDLQASTQEGTAVCQGDITDEARLSAILAELRPGLVFHLAALTDPRLDYSDLHRVNVLGTMCLLSAMQRACPDATVLITSTSSVYGRVSEAELPIHEDQRLRPVNPYAVSKITQEMIAYQRFAAYGMRTIRTRAFNITGPGESAAFVTSGFARQIAAIETGRQEPVLCVGNLDAVRDFTDVRDVVCAYRLVAEQGEPGTVYNVCSMQGTPIRLVLDTLLQLSTAAGIEVQTDVSRLQQADVPIQVGDAGRLRSLAGWLPAIPLARTLHDVLAFWREHIDEER